jgi:hypothetical protein
MFLKFDYYKKFDAIAVSFIFFLIIFILFTFT